MAKKPERSPAKVPTDVPAEKASGEKPAKSRRKASDDTEVVSEEKPAAKHVKKRPRRR